MRNELIAKSCRICLTETKKLRSLYKPIDEGDEPPNRMLYLITGIKVEKLDEHETLPKNICKNCELSLNMAYEFRENALKTQQIIEAYLKELYENDSNEEDKSAVSIYRNEYEAIMNLEPLDCVNELDDNMQELNNDQNKYLENSEEFNGGDNFDEINDPVDNIYNDQETSFQINDSKDIVKDENYFGHQQDEEYESKIFVDKGENEYLEEHLEITPAVEDTYVFNKKSPYKTRTEKPNKKKIPNISTKYEKNTCLPENMKLIPRRGRKPTKNSNQNSHICDICGNVFAKRGRMMEHRQRHDTEFKFGCEICDKKFLTRELLRKHMFSHSGGKPLKCEYCSRTFYYESVRKAHEAVHKGLRPYICDVCNKDFSYAHALTKHKLIHEEIKLYRCEYCNKDFRLQHHMKQHELTKLHQNAVRFSQRGNKSLEGCDQPMKPEHLEDDLLLIEEVTEDQMDGSS